MPQITLRQADATIPVGADQTILDAALAQKIRYPFGCRSGNCGACKSRLLAGRVRHKTLSRFALSDEEKARGLILACRAVPLEDGVVAWLELDEKIVHPWRELECRVDALERASAEVVIVTLEIVSGGPFSFAAGQYASVRFAGQPARDFSFANRPDETHLRFHVRVREEGRVSRHVRDSLAVGDRVVVAGPQGRAFLRGQHPGPIVAVAGGTGLGPMLAIVETALARGLGQPISLWFGARDIAGLYGLPHLRELARRHDNLDIILCADDIAGDAPDGFHLRPGSLPRAMADAGTDFTGRIVYCAGPPAMVDAVAALALARGGRPEDVHADPFTPADAVDC